MAIRNIDKHELLRQLRVIVENDAVAEVSRLLGDLSSDFAVTETEAKVADMIGTVELRAARLADDSIVPGYLEFAKRLRGLGPDEKLRNVYLETHDKSFCLTLTSAEGRVVGCISFTKSPRVMAPPFWAGTLDSPSVTPRESDPDDDPA